MSCAFNNIKRILRNVVVVFHPGLFWVSPGSQAMRGLRILRWPPCSKLQSPSLRESLASCFGDHQDRPTVVFTTCQVVQGLSTLEEYAADILRYPDKLEGSILLFGSPCLTFYNGSWASFNDISWNTLAWFERGWRLKMCKRDSSFMIGSPCFPNFLNGSKGPRELLFFQRIYDFGRG